MAARTITDDSDVDASDDGDWQTITDSVSDAEVFRKAVLDAMRHVALLCCAGLETGRLRLYDIPFSVWIYLACDFPDRLQQLQCNLEATVQRLECRRVRMRTDM